MDPIDLPTELTRIGALPLGQRAAALEALADRLEAALESTRSPVPGVGTPAEEEAAGER